MDELTSTPHSDLYTSVATILEEARKNVVSSVNSPMARAYFEIGRQILLEEQNGNQRAGYGKAIISELSKRLTADFGRGFSVTNLKPMGSFYQCYSKGQTLSDEFNLSWSNYPF